MTSFFYIWIKVEKLLGNHNWTFW